MEREGNTAEALHCIAEKERAPGAGHGGDPIDRLDDADLVIDQHRGDEAGAFVDEPIERVEVGGAVGVDGRKLDVEALAAEPFDRVEDAGMFGGKGDDAAFALGNWAAAPLRAQLAASVAPEVKYTFPAPFVSSDVETLSTGAGASRLRSKRTVGDVSKQTVGDVKRTERAVRAARTRSRATSIAARASRPMRWELWGLPKLVSIHGRMAAATSGASGVVAW
jgi:hypothetical protein